MAYIIHYDIAALIVTITVLLYFNFKKTIETRQNRIFATFIALVIISNISDIITIFTISYPGCVPRWFDIFVNALYLLTFNGVAVVYCAYINYQTKSGVFTPWDKIRIAVPYAIIALLIISTWFTELIFYFDDNGIYSHGPLFMWLYVSAFYYVISSLVQSIIYYKKLTKAQFVTVFFFTISNLGAIALQILIPRLMIVQMMVSITLLLIYLSLENPEDYRDKMLETYNNLAFMEVFEGYVRREKKFSVLGIQVDGLKYINENLGVIAGNKLMVEVSECLKDYAGKNNIYHLSGAQFAIMSSNQSLNWDWIMDSISSRFKKSFMCGDMEISLTCHMCMLTYPDTVTRLEDAIDMIEYSLKASKTTGDGRVVYADKEILEKGKKENAILQAVNQALRANSFEVYYQPIYSVKEQRFTTAEALVRLGNKKVGFISPEEFIPIAEKNGLITQIGELLFRKLCIFYKESQVDKYGIDNIHFNLSIVECMQEHLYERLIRTMDEVGLEHSKISLEITETAAVASKDTLLSNMKKLIDSGMRFVMDDYGTGFSNTATIISYPFSEIKIDKSMVWSAMEDTKAMTALKHSVAMMKDLEYKIVAEGVETEEQAQMLKEMGCDFFQGYLYSRPICGDDFAKLMREELL